MNPPHEKAEVDLAAIATSAETMRRRFRPARISVLFVGESAPAGGKFFYDGNSHMYRAFREALGPKLGHPSDFFHAFVERGYYLDDLVLTPVNWLTGTERRRLHRDSVQSLSERLRAYRPLVIISVLKVIRPPVEQAREAAGLNVPHYTVSFPGMAGRRSSGERWRRCSTFCRSGRTGKGGGRA